MIHRESDRSDRREERGDPPSEDILQYPSMKRGDGFEPLFAAKTVR